MQRGVKSRIGLSSHKISTLSPTIRLSAHPLGLIVSVENKDDRIQDFLQDIEEDFLQNKIKERQIQRQIEI